jgi:long-chain acyl-CoA synthetase
MAINIKGVHEKSAEITGPGGFFELEDRVIDGFTYPAYKHAPRTSIELIQNARGHGDAEFLVYEGRRYSYNQFFECVDALAHSLQARGIARGERLAIAMRNNPEWMIAFAAGALVGAVVVPINSWGKTEELLYALNDSGARWLVCDPARFKLVQGSLSDLDVNVIVADEGGEPVQATGVSRFAELLADGAGQSAAVADAAPEDECLILYTSGSTGFPKGVVHRHIGLSQAFFNMMYLGMLVMSLEGAREFRGGATVETPLLTVPLFHATGLLSGFYLPLALGQKVVMMYRWDTVRALELIRDEKVTSLSSVPAIVQDLLAHPEFDNYDTSSLIRVTGAGAAMPAGLPELIESKCRKPSRSAGYGMTETFAVGSTMSGCLYDLKPDTSGMVSPLMRFRTVDADGRVLPAGEPGEIEMYGITCTPGYWHKPEANAATFVDGRWMKSGDVGFVDEDGFVHITGRIKEIVIRGGENIYPGEIEAVAYELEAVHECVVFGEPDDAMGEELVMVVYVTPGRQLSEQDLRDWLGNRLAAYKVPRTIVFSPQPLPRNASEKLHKLKVKEAFLASE